MRTQRFISDRRGLLLECTVYDSPMNKYYGFGPSLYLLGHCRNFDYVFVISLNTGLVGFNNILVSRNCSLGDKGDLQIKRKDYHFIEGIHIKRSINAGEPIKLID